MKDDLVAVYDAKNLADARMLCDRLEDAGVKTFIDNDDSPLDGLSAGVGQDIVRVLPTDVEKARPIVEAFIAEAGDAV